MNARHALRRSKQVEDARGERELVNGDQWRNVGAALVAEYDSLRQNINTGKDDDVKMLNLDGAGKVGCETGFDAPPYFAGKPNLEYGYQGDGDNPDHTCKQEKCPRRPVRLPLHATIRLSRIVA